MTNATPDTNVSAYRRGWQASKRTTTADLDAASDRYVKRYGRDYLRAFVAGWSDYAADADYNPPTDETVTADETFATIPDALRAAADLIETYDVPIGYVFDITETDR